LNIFNSVGSTYEPGDTVRISSTTVNSSGYLVNATVNVSIFNPDGTPLNSGLSTPQSIGRYEYSFVAPSTQGTYTADIDANYSGDEIHDTEAFIVSTGAGGGGNLSTPPRVFVEAPTVIGLNTNFSITMLSTDDSGLAADCTAGTANITIRDTISGTEPVSNQAMTWFATGLYNYTYSASSTSSYVAIVTCTQSLLEYVGITTFSTQGFSITGGNIVELKGFDEVVADNDYRTKLWIFDINGNPIDADSVPTVILYDANENPVTGWVSMTKNGTGIYTYSYTTSSGQIEGDWETKVNVTVNGITIYPSEFWDLVGGIFDVRNIVINNPAVNSLQISVTTENMGGAAKDLTLQWALTRIDTEEQLDAGADTFAVSAYSTRDWVIYPTTSYVGPVKILFLGTYSGTEKAGAFKLFSTTSEIVTPPSEDTGGGGGGTIVPRITGGVIEEISILTIDTKILERYSDIFTGEKIVAEIIISYSPPTEEVKNAGLDYHVEDLEGNVIMSASELISVKGETKILREFNLPNQTGVGGYWFVSNIEYGDLTASSKDRFNIVEEKPEEEKPAVVEKRDWEFFSIKSFIWLIIILLIIIIIILLITRRRKRGYAKPQSKRKIYGFGSKRKIRKEKDLNKLVRYIKKEI
jgi:hypothetical protein